MDREWKEITHDVGSTDPCTEVSFYIEITWAKCEDGEIKSTGGELRRWHRGHWKSPKSMTLNRVINCGSLTNWKEKYKVTDVQTSEDGLSPVTDFNTPSRFLC